MTYSNRYFNSTIISLIKWNICFPGRFFFTTFCARKFLIVKGKSCLAVWLFVCQFRIDWN